MRVLVFLLPALFVATVVHGAEQSQVPKKMIGELQGLVGTWEVEGRIGDEKITATWSARWAPGKHCLMRRSTRLKEDQKIVGIGVIGWDAATETITEQVFFSNNDCALLRWKVMSPDKWEGVVTGFLDGEAINNKVKFTKKGPDEILYEEEGADGKEIEAILRKISRKKEKGPKTAVGEGQSR